MKKTVFAILAVSLIAFAAVAGCVTTPEEEPASPVGEWVSSDGFVLSLNPDGTVFVFGENTYRGTYELTEESISIDIDDSTKVAAPQKEATFITTLDFVTEYTFENGDLLLTAEGEQTLRFQRSLVGTWETNDGCTLTFNKDKTFSDRAINGLTGTYEFAENGVELSLGVQTLVAGSEKEMETEAAFFDALRATTDFTKSENKLTLYDAEGKELVTLTAYDETSADEPRKVVRMYLQA